MSLKKYTLILLLLLAPATHAQLWNGVIDSSRAIDWTQAGTTITPGSTQCGSTISPLGTLLSPGDLAAAIFAIMPSCTAGQYILIGSGNFYTSTNIEWYIGGACNAVGAPSPCRASGIEIRGATPAPHIYFVGSSVGSGSQNNSAVAMEGGNNSVINENNMCDWTGGFAQGATVLQLGNCGTTTPANGSVSNLRADSGGTGGTMLILDQVDELADNATIWNCTINGSCANSGSGGFTRSDGPCLNSGTNCFRSQTQGVKVTAIQTTGTLAGFTCSSSAPCLTISPGLYMPNWRIGQLPQAWFGPYVQNDGISNLILDYTYTVGLGQGTSLLNCYKCWVSGVEGIDAPRSHVALNYAWHSVVKDSYFYQNTGTSAATGSMAGSGGCTLTASSATFSSLMTAPGLNTLYISGVGAGGTWLTTTVTVYTDSTHVTVSPCSATAASGQTIKGTYYQHSAVSYGIEQEIDSDNLVVNNICQQVTDSCPNSDGGSEGDVAFGNFAIADIYTSAGFAEANFYRHASGDDLNLLEDNIGLGANADDIHGTHAFVSYFRNFFSGNQSFPCAGVACNAQTNAINLNAGVRYFNLVGNVLGDSTLHTIYKCAATTSSSCNGGNGTPVELIFGYSGNGGINAGSPNGYCLSVGCGSTGAYDPQVSSYALLWNNFDSVTNANRWCGNSSDTGWAGTCGSTSEVPTSLASYSNPVPSKGDTGIGQGALPNSFFYASKPSWFGSLAWPSIDPNGSGGNVLRCTSGTYNGSYVLSSGQCSGGSVSSAIYSGRVSANPAMTCFLNTMNGPPDGSGGVLTFNSGTCYGGITPPPPSATAPCAQCMVENRSAPTMFVGNRP